VTLTPPVGFPPAGAAVEAKPAHFVLRGRRILWILEVVRCVPVEVEDGEGMITAYANSKTQGVQLFSWRDWHVIRYLSRRTRSVHGSFEYLLSMIHQAVMS